MKDHEKQQGIVPLRSMRKGHVGQVPADFPSGVTISKSSHVLTFVESIEHIEDGPIHGRAIVDCWIIDNGEVKVTAIARGGNVVSIEKNGKEYLWQNRDGAAYYGAGSNAFPLSRGLILHGGVRIGAVTAEHGLYYDSDWDVDFTADGDGSSIILSIKDTQENRDLLCDTLSSGKFLASNSEVPMSKYPVTDADYVLTITLRPGEDFVRLRVALVNTKRTPVLSEIWLPQTYPITVDSQVISHQRRRRCKDLWVYDAMLKENFLAQDMRLDKDSDKPPYAEKAGFLIGIPPTPTSAADANLDFPLDWPTSVGGILYDYPHRDGSYHAVSFGDGRGAAYVTQSKEDQPQYTKMWSWGNPSLYDREQALQQDPPLAAGRPKTDYYEPWGSGFTPAFFEPTEFPPGESAWDALIVPIESGLGRDKTRAELRQAVDKVVDTLVAETGVSTPKGGAGARLSD